MATAENAKLEYEAGQAAVAMSALTDSGGATGRIGRVAFDMGRTGKSASVGNCRPEDLGRSGHGS